MTSSPPTRYQVASGVATITMDAPERRNAFGSALMRSLMGHFEQALDDPAVRVIVLTNAGSTFSAGADLKEGRDPSLEPGRQLFHDILDAVDPLSETGHRTHRRACCRRRRCPGRCL